MLVPFELHTYFIIELGNTTFVTPKGYTTIEIAKDTHFLYETVFKELDEDRKGTPFKDRGKVVGSLISSNRGDFMDNRPLVEGDIVEKNVTPPHEHMMDRIVKTYIVKWDTRYGLLILKHIDADQMLAIMNTGSDELEVIGNIYHNNKNKKYNKHKKDLINGRGFELTWQYDKL